MDRRGGEAARQVGQVSDWCRTAADAALHGAEKAMDRWANICMAGAESKDEQRLRVAAWNRRSDDRRGDDPADAEAIDRSSTARLALFRRPL